MDEQVIKLLIYVLLIFIAVMVCAVIFVVCLGNRRGKRNNTKPQADSDSTVEANVRANWEEEDFYCDPYMDDDIIAVERELNEKEEAMKANSEDTFGLPTTPSTSSMINENKVSANNDVVYLREELNRVKEAQAEQDIKKAESSLTAIKIVCVILIATLAFMIPCWWHADSARKFVINPDGSNEYTGEYGYYIGDGIMAMDTEAMTSLRDSYAVQSTIWSVMIIANIVLLVIMIVSAFSAKDKVLIARGKLNAIHAEVRVL